MTKCGILFLATLFYVHIHTFLLDAELNCIQLLRQRKNAFVEQTEFMYSMCCTFKFCFYFTLGALILTHYTLVRSTTLYMSKVTNEHQNIHYLQKWHYTRSFTTSQVIRNHPICMVVAEIRKASLVESENSHSLKRHASNIAFWTHFK